MQIYTRDEGKRSWKYLQRKFVIILSYRGKQQKKKCEWLLGQISSAKPPTHTLRCKLLNSIFSIKFEQEGPKMDDFKTKVFACEEEKNLR